VSAFDPFESISRACFRSFSVLPNATLIDDGELFGVANDIPLPFFNGIALTRVQDEAAVARTIDAFRAQGRPFRWWITPSTRPSSLAEVLQAHGMRHAFDSAGMTADLTSLPDPSIKLTIRRVDDRRAMEQATELLLTVFERPRHEWDWWVRAYEHCGFDASSPWSHFIAYDGDTPVATSAVLLEGKLAGIYHVSTVPSARGRGIGAAVTLEALRYARERGATRAALQSSAMAVNVYKSIGFVEECTLRLYDWRPEYEG
jgi:GNAT superfamily N-acetyltransferase